MDSDFDCFYFNCRDGFIVMIFIKILFPIFICFFYPSCQVTNKEYNFVYKNVGKTPLENVKGSFNDFHSAGGALYPEMIAHHKMVNKHGPIPDMVDVNWTRVSDRKKFHKKLNVRSELPKGEWSGDIIFLFDNDDVHLTWKKN